MMYVLDDLQKSVNVLFHGVPYDLLDSVNVLLHNEATGPDTDLCQVVFPEKWLNLQELLAEFS
jgi:hypothetical protein